MRNLIALFVLPFILACSAFDKSGLRHVAPACLVAPWSGSQSPQSAAAETDRPHHPVLHTVTYNIHSGMGDWKLLWSSRATVERYLNGIADEIAAVATTPVDIVALNEVDFSARRSGDIDQARYLADALRHR